MSGAKSLVGGLLFAFVLDCLQVLGAEFPRGGN